MEIDPAQAFEVEMEKVNFLILMTKETDFMQVHLRISLLFFHHTHVAHYLLQRLRPRPLPALYVHFLHHMHR